MDQSSAQITQHIRSGTTRRGGKVHDVAVDEAPLNEDLIFHMEPIAVWFGLTHRQASHKAAIGALPGTFRMGGLWVCSKSAAREAVRLAAMAAGKPTAM